MRAALGKWSDRFSLTDLTYWSSNVTFSVTADSLTAGYSSAISSLSAPPPPSRLHTDVLKSVISLLVYFQLKTNLENSPQLTHLQANPRSQVFPMWVLKTLPRVKYSPHRSRQNFLGEKSSYVVNSIVFLGRERTFETFSTPVTLYAFLNKRLK